MDELWRHPDITIPESSSNMYELRGTSGYHHLRPLGSSSNMDELRGTPDMVGWWLAPVSVSVGGGRHSPTRPRVMRPVREASLRDGADETPLQALYEMQAEGGERQRRFLSM